jgi:O-acetyl-ADP-ribose deacetylase (regulator of RNase III)
MALNTVHGDLIQMALEGDFDAIIHGCNCFCTMGAGVARGVREKFPDAYAADLNTVKGDKSKLGLFTYADCKIKAIRNVDSGKIISERNLTVINAYTQYGFSDGEKDVFEYDAFRHALSLVKRKFGDVRIGLPEIGMGLACGDRARIMAIIEEAAQTMDLTLVVYDPKK